MTHLFVDRRRDARDADADERRVHRRQLSAGRPTARASPSITASTRSPASGGSADISIVTVADARGAQAGDAGRPRLASGLVARRIAHRVRDGDGESRLLLHATASSPTVPAGGGAPTVLSSAFDEDPSIVAWKPSGLFFSASRAHLLRICTGSIRTTKAIAKISPADQTVELRLLAVAATAARSRSCAPTRRRWPRCTSRPASRHSEEADRHERADRGLDDEHARSRVVEEPGRRRRSKACCTSRPTSTRRASTRCSSSSTAGRPACRARCRSPARSIRSTSGCRAASSCSSRTTAAAPATARSSARSTSATSASATRGTCCRASTR